MRIYKNEIKSVFEDDICIGYIARRSAILRTTKGINDMWMYSPTIVAPMWLGNYLTRKEAIEALNEFIRN